MAEGRTSAAKRWAAPAGRTRPPTARLAASRDPAPPTGSPRSATARPSHRCRRRRRTGSTPPAEAAHTTGTSEPRFLPNPPHPDSSMRYPARHHCRRHQPPKSPSVPAPGDHSPPEQDSPLEQELNGVPYGQQRIRNRRRVFPPRHQYLQQAAQNMLVRLWPAHCRSSTEGRQAGRDGQGQDSGPETPHKRQNLRTGGLS